MWFFKKKKKVEEVKQEESAVEVEKAEEKAEVFEEKVLKDDVNGDITVKVGSQSNRYLKKLNALDAQLKEYYTEIKNELLSYKGWQNSFTKDGDTFIYQFKTRAKLTVLNGELKFFVNIDKDKVDGRFKFDESEYKKYSVVPIEFTINKDVEIRKAKSTIKRLAESLGISKRKRYGKKTFKKLTMQ